MIKKLIIGTIISYIVTALLSSIDKRLAWLYVILVFMVILLAFKDQFFPAIGELTGSVVSNI